MTTHLKTRTIVRCCWRMWFYSAVITGNAISAVLHFGADELVLAAMFAGVGAFIASMLLAETRSSFAAMAEADVREAVNQFCSGE